MQKGIYDCFYILHEKEIKCAKAIAKHYGIERYTLDVSKIFKNSECALLKGRKEQIQNGSYDEQIKIAEGELKY